MKNLIDKIIKNNISLSIVDNKIKLLYYGEISYELLFDIKKK